MFRFTESRNSRDSTANPPTVTLRYSATGSNDDVYVKAYAINATPAQVFSVQHGTLYRQDVRITWEGYEIARVEVPYGQQERQTGSYRISFDTTGATINAKYSKETIAAFGRPQDDPPSVDDFKNLIGVNGDNVEGADIVVPVLRMTVNFSHPLGVIDIARVKALANWTGRTNSDVFLTFEPGEVLFLGASGIEGSDAETEIAYNYAMTPNEEDVSIGEVVNIMAKGWHKVWVRYRDDVTNNISVKQPKAVYVERVYDELAFVNAFGFGG